MQASRFHKYKSHRVAVNCFEQTNLFIVLKTVIIIALVLIRDDQHWRFVDRVVKVRKNTKIISHI